MSEISVYKTSSQALAARRRLLGFLKIFAAMALTLVAAAFDLFNPSVWALLAAAFLALWFLDLSRWLESYAARELRLQAHAVEEHRLGFTRLVLFEQVEQLRVRQGKNEKILTLELHTPQGSFVIQGYENMENLFGFLSRHKPEDVIIEMEEISIDWQSPMPWILLVLSSGLSALLILMFTGLI